eukprot:6205276-Pleurochrysis_carterae.AAC.1
MLQLLRSYSLCEAKGVTDSCSYSTVKNGAQKLDCGVFVDLEGRKFDAPLPECVEGDVHAAANRI